MAGDDDIDPELVFDMLGIDVSYSQVRVKFRRELFRLFALFGIKFVDAELTVAENIGPRWCLTVVHPQTGIETLSLQLALDADPYAHQTFMEMKERIRAWATGQ